MPVTVLNKKSVSRLSRYRRALQTFKELGYTKIISTTLGEATGATSSQVRKDFSAFGLSGYKKGGYHIEELLGKDRVHKIVLVGIGNIGTALINYKAFEDEGMKVVAGFDIDPVKLNRKLDIPLYHIDQLKAFVEENAIRIGVIAVPSISAQKVCEGMLSAGIKGILNFAPIRLKVNEDTVITNVNILGKLENVLFFVHGL